MKIKWYIMGIFLSSLASCSEQKVLRSEYIDSYPELFPDYINVTIPPEIAPLNFKLKNSTNSIQTVMKNKQGDSLLIDGKNGKINIPIKRWKKFLIKSVGDTISVTVSEREHECKKIYNPFYMYVANDSIDRYIVYRMIEPTYANWNDMTLSQRDLYSFDEKVLLDNRKLDNNCMNCHTFNNNNSNELVFHSRKHHPGTIIVKDDKIVKLNTKTDNTISHFVYPYWHPSGNTIAFSTNSTHMSFFYNNPCLLEVYDTSSDIILYDIEKNEVYTSPLIATPNYMESFPFFSPKGDKLYFCVSNQPKDLPKSYKEVKYKIASIDFNEATHSFGDSIHFVINLDSVGKSVSLPSISPDGKYLLCSTASRGCFLSWNPKADLFLYDIEQERKMDISLWNSDSSESYTSWSSNGRWVIFTSRRLDNLYNRPFIAHIDSSGHLGKPFLLPQHNTDYYDRLFKAFNMPKFIHDEVGMSPSRMYREILSEQEKQVQFDLNSFRPIVKSKNGEIEGVN